MRAASALALLLLTTVIWGCGQGGDPTATSTPPDSRPAATEGEPRREEEGDRDDSGGGVGQFIHEGSDNSIQESGTEADDSAREEAALALHGFLDAGVQRDWDGACRHLSKRAFEQIAAAFGARGKPCPLVLERFFAAVPKKDFVEAAEADVGSFRTDGEGGVLLYHGARGLDYQMPMVLEAAQWKVAAIAGSPLP